MILHTHHTVHDGRARTGVLHRSLPGLSKKMLVQTLREMEHSGLIERRVESAVPPAVRYSLTPLGQRFVGLVELVLRLGASQLRRLGRTSPTRLFAPKGGLEPWCCAGEYASDYYRQQN